MAKKKKDKDIEKAEMPKSKPDVINKDIMDMVDFKNYEKEKGELHPEDPRAGDNMDTGKAFYEEGDKTLESEIERLINLAKKRKKFIGKEVNAAKGGSMSKQMEMFEEGGLKEEGGMIDEESGNDVPIGSTREEVRDDIPAQLSEGEFVFPADVVRFIGLEKLMQMRQKAKMGLKKMEDMGQMGNSEEATMPDDMPFSVDDLDMEDDKEEEVTDSNFNRGGVVTMAEGGTTPTTENKALNFNQGGDTNKGYGDFYKFKMPGSSKPNNFANPFTKDGKQYFGFRPLQDGRIAAYRQVYRNYDDADAGKLSSVMDVLDEDTKFSITNPQTDIDPPNRAPMTVSEMARMKDGTFVSRYVPLTNEVYYKNLVGYLDSNKTLPKPVTETAKPKPVIETTKTKPVDETTKTTFDIPFPSRNKVKKIESTDISSPKELPKTNNTTENKNAFLNFKLPQKTMSQQKPLNVRQQDVPMRGMVTNIPKTSDFLKKKPANVNTAPNFANAIPSNIGSRFTNILDTSKQGEKKEVNSIEGIKNEIFAITDSTLDSGDSIDTSGSSNAIQQGGIDYSLADRFDLDDNLRDVLNEFSMSQINMFSVLTSSPLATFASAAGTALAPYTGGFTAQGSIAKAELGKTQATAFHQSALQIQKEYGLTNVSNINDWSSEAKAALAKQGRVALDFGKDIYYASVGKPYSTYSFNEAEQKSFTEKAKGIMDSIKNFGKATPEPNMFEVTNKQKGLSNLFSNISTLAKESLASKIQAEKDLNDTLAGDPLGDEDKTNEELSKLNFNNGAISDIEANGGVKEIKQNPNGTSYTVNVNGTFTHFDGTTVNFTDSKGNPGNAPKAPKTEPPPVYTPPSYIPISGNNNNDTGGGNVLDTSSRDFSSDGMGGWT